MSAGESKPTHFRTPGCEHRVVKLALLGGGVEEGAEVAAPSPEPPPPPPQAATATLRSAPNERFLMGRSSGLLVLIEKEGGAGVTGLRNERYHAVVGNRGDDDSLRITRPRDTDCTRRNARAGLLSPRSRPSGVQLPKLAGAEQQEVAAYRLVDQQSLLYAPAFPTGHVRQGGEG